MRYWMGMTKTSLAGDISEPDDEHPGAANIRKQPVKKPNIGGLKKPATSKIPSTPKATVKPVVKVPKPTPKK